jgi:uncharacterized membrane protein
MQVLSKHRIEALTDGIYAVAMTLLVIELKLGNVESIKTHPQLVEAISHLLPKFIAWVISFFVLALFWLGNHRLFQYVKHVDGKLVALCLLQLAAVSLMPFASSLSGEFVKALVSQIAYSGMMSILAVAAMLVSRYIYTHPALCATPMTRGVYKAAQFRLWGLIFISVLAVVITLEVPGMGNTAFVLMLLIGPISRRIERHHDAPRRPANHSESQSAPTLSV